MWISKLLQNLSVSQVLSIYFVEKGKNVFITGSPGCGKSHVTKTIEKYLFLKGKTVLKTSSTASSGFVIDAPTTHSQLGLSIGDKPLAECIRKMHQFGLFYRLSVIDTLIIDEVSMIKIDYLDKVNLLFQYIHGNDRPFGGIQLVCVGDFSQLKIDEEYVFNSKSWKDANFTNVLLRENYRQEKDPEFFEVLEKIRWGRIDGKLMQYLRSLSRPLSELDETPIALYSTNLIVDAFNTRIAQSRQNKVYVALGPTEYFDRLPNPAVLKLFVGCRVIMSSNKWQKSHGVFNGSSGIILDLYPKSVLVKFGDVHLEVTYAEWEFYGNAGVAVVSMLPLKYGYAITVHRIQGLTVKQPIYFNGGDVFGPSLAYVALSRVETGDKLFLENITEEALKVDETVLEFNKKIKKEDKRLRENGYFKHLIEDFQKKVFWLPSCA